MKIHQLLIVTLFACSLIACNRSAVDEIPPVHPTQGISNISAPTNTPTEKTTAATRYPTMTPSASTTATVEVTATPTYSPSPTRAPTPVSESINKTGPWLMLSPDIFYSGASRIIGPVFINADGTGWEPANLPHDPHSPPEELDWWFGSISPKGPYMAFQDYFSEYQPRCSEDGIPSKYVYTITLYILKLPENKVVRQIPLFGPKSSEQIHKDECEYVKQGRYDTPPTLGVVQGYGSWSPDGQYYVFSAAPDGYGADLYLYEMATDTLRRLTNRQNNPDILGWSPDGKTIIYRSITKMELIKSQFLESDGLYAVTVYGSDRLLFHPEVIPVGLQWLSESQFLISDGVYDFWGSGLTSTHLRLVNLVTGVNEVLYRNDQILIDYATDPIHHLLMISNPPADMPGLSGLTTTPDEYRPGLAYVYGIFQYDFQAHSLQPVLMENLPDLYWNEDLLAFSSGYHEQVPPYTRHTTFIRYVPGEGFEIERITDDEETSPDGHWSIGKVEEDWYIQDSRGQPVQKLFSHNGSWAPDSSSYITIVQDDQKEETILMVYQKKDNWQPVLTRQIFYGQMWRGRWITP